MATDADTDAYIDEIVADLPPLDEDQAELVGRTLRDAIQTRQSGEAA